MLCMFTCVCCGDKNQIQIPEVDDPVQDSSLFYWGADLSYVNEMVDCGVAM